MRIKTYSIFFLLFFLTACNIFQGPDPNNSTTSNSSAPNYDYKIFFVQIIAVLPSPVSNIASMNSDGSNEITLYTNGGVCNYPAPSEDGSKVVFVAGGDLYVMNYDGSNATLIYSPASGTISYPVFTADGSQIYFSLLVSGIYQIYKINSDGSGVATNVSGGTSYNDQQVRFSPDGSKMVFASERDGNYEIYIMNADGSGTATQLTNTTGSTIANQYPSFSPDSSTVVFTRDDGSSTEIYTVPASGGTETQRSFLISSTLMRAQYSPDGTKFIYMRTSTYSNFFSFNIADSSESQITNASMNTYSNPFVSKAVY